MVQLSYARCLTEPVARAMPADLRLMVATSGRAAQRGRWYSERALNMNWSHTEVKPLSSMAATTLRGSEASPAAIITAAPPIELPCSRMRACRYLPP